MAAEDAPDVPPARRVHLPVASDRQPQLKQPLEIDVGCRIRHALSSPV
jgi:hypothetical protein